MLLIKPFNYVLIITICLLLVGLPQINISDYVQPTITSKFVIFVYSCIVIVGIWILLFSFSKPKAIEISKLDITLFLLLSYIIINRYLIQPNYGFSIRYLELLGLSFIYIILRTLSIKNYILFLLVIVISGIIQAVYGNLQLFGYYPSNHSGFKMTGSFFNPGPYAGFLTAVYPTALGMYLFKEKIVKQVQSQLKSNLKIINVCIAYIFEYIPLLGMVSIILVIPALRSRAAWLAVLLSSFVILEFRYHYIKKGLKQITHTKKVALIVLIISILSVGLFGIYHFKKGSSDGRLFIWKVSTEIIKDNPVFGVGFDRFKAHYMNYQADYFAKHGETTEAFVADNTYYTFNDWLQFIIENGLIGFLMLVIALFVLFKTEVNIKNNHFFLLIKGTILAFGIFALFSYPMQILPIKLILVILLAFLGSLDKKKFSILKFDNTAKPYASRVFKITVCIVVLMSLSKAIIYTQSLDKSFKTWKNAMSIYQYGDYKGAIKEYKKAHSILKKNGGFLMNYGKALSMNIQNEEAIQILKEAKQQLNTTIIETALGDSNKALKQYKKAEKAYQHAANMIPSRFYPNYLLAKLYEVSGQKGKAIAKANELITKEIKIPSTAIKEIKIEMNKLLDKSHNK